MCVFLKINVWLAVINILSFYVSGAVIYDDNNYRLDFVHYNDFHDRFEETTVSYPVCDTNDNNCLGGFARLYYEINFLLRDKPNALLLNAGDAFQGTYWYTLMKWNITQKFINLLPNDVHTIGNHEFDDGVEGLAPYLAALHAPVVVANIDTSAVPALNDLYKPHIIIERSGRRIGIIGLITPETKTSSNPGAVIFLDPIDIVEKEAQLLTQKGVDIIIVLSHCGLKVDKRMATIAGENIDIIVGGHSHSLLWNGDAPSKEYVSGPYPIVVNSKSKPGHKVLVVTASAFSKYLGNMTAYFDRSGEMTSFSASPVYLNRSIPEDPQMKALLQPYVNKLHSLVKEVVGFTEEDLLSPSCGSGECKIGNFIADAFLNATAALKVSNLTHVSFILRNMIRGSIAKGEITRGTIINTMPFTNTVVTLILPGRHLINVFRKCMGNYWVEKPFSGPWMPHVSGMKLTLNLTEGVNIDIQVKHGEDDKPLELDREYQVSTLGFLVRNGNEFAELKRYGRDFKVVGKDTEVLEEFVKISSPINPLLEHRITVIN